MIKQKKLVVIVSGSGSNLGAIIDACKSGFINASIELVIADKKCFGLTRAANVNIDNEYIPCDKVETREAYDKRLINKIDECQPDFIILAGFMRILSSCFVGHYRDKLINIHPSILPKYKGLNTHHRAIAANDKLHGSSVHIVIEDLDSGSIIAQSKLEIKKEDTPETLQERIKLLEHALYPKVIQMLCDDKIKIKNNCIYLDNESLVKSSEHVLDGVLHISNHGITEF